MSIRRILAAVITTAALAGLGLTGTTTAQAAAPNVTGTQCRNGGGTVVHQGFGNYVCLGGTYNSHPVSAD